MTPRHTEIKESVRKLYNARKARKRMTEELQEIEKEECKSISNYMYCNCPNEKSIEVLLDEHDNFYLHPTVVRVTKSNRTTVNYNIPKIKQIFDKGIVKRILTKRYEISDMEGLIKYLKSCGVNPKEFKRYIDVQESVNEQELEQMYSMGEIDKKQFRSCCDVDVGKTVFTLTEVKKI